MRHVLAVSLAATFALFTGSRATGDSLRRPSIPDTLAAAACSSPAFGSPRYFAATGSDIFAFDVADVNGDASLDFVAVDYREVGAHALNVFLGDGQGGFTVTSSDLADDGDFIFLRAVDVTGDGRRDLVLAGWDSAFAVRIDVLRGDGTGAFSPWSSVTFGSVVGSFVSPQGLGLGDLDEDGDLDVVVATMKDDGTFTSGTVHVLNGDGAGNFAAPTDIALGVTPNDLTIADFNEDGHLDLAISGREGAGAASGTVEIRLGDPVGGFGPVVSSQSVPAPFTLATGDFNEDAHLDLAVATAPPANQASTATLLAGDGLGRIAAPVSFPVGGRTFVIVSADLTGDGHLDLLLSGPYHTAGQTYVSLLEFLTGAGDGTFAGPTVLPIDLVSIGPAVGDFDGDGRPDLAVGGGGPEGGRIAVLLSMCGNAADLAVSLTATPDPVLTGRTVEHGIEIVNNGPDPASVTMSVAIPAGLSFVSASATAGACIPSTGSAVPSPWDRTVRCTVGDLAGSAPGNSSAITVVTTALAAGFWTTVATVATTVLDAAPGNNSATVTTQVIVPGGRDLTIAAAPAGGTSLTWTEGDAQAGYIVWRKAGAVTTRFPESGLLPADITAFTDQSAIEGQLNCYRVVAAAPDETPITASSILCLSPNSASPVGTLGGFRLRLVSTFEARLDWSPFGGQTGYIMRRYTTAGQSDFSLSETDTSVQLTVAEFTCFVLIPVNGSTALGNSDALCAQPGATP